MPRKQGAPASPIPDHDDYFDERHDQHLASLDEWPLMEACGAQDHQGWLKPYKSSVPPIQSQT